jgi:hypothetical protein
MHQRFLGGGGRARRDRAATVASRRSCNRSHDRCPRLPPRGRGAGSESSPDAPQGADALGALQQRERPGFHRLPSPRLVRPAGHPRPEEREPGTPVAGCRAGDRQPGPPGRRASGTRRAHRTVRPPLDDGSRKPHPGRHRCGRRREAGHHQPMPAQAALSSGIRARPAYSEAMLRVMSLGSLLLCRERLSAARRRSTERT